MGQLKMLKILIFSLTIFFGSANAQVMKRSNCAVPLDEAKSAPAIDLLDQNRKPIDRDGIIDLIHQGMDTSLFEPQVSDIYVHSPQKTVEYSAEFPDENALSLNPLEFISSIQADHLTQARVTESVGKKREYRLSITYDLNAALEIGRAHV